MYNHAPADYVCPFCSLVQGISNEQSLSVRSDIVYEDDVTMAFVGSHQWPNNPGNVLVIPKEHYENLYDVPAELAAEVQKAAKAIALAMKAAWSCAGVSTRQHNEPAGNQDVWHYHLHVTPRYEGDGFYGTRRALMPAHERARYARELRTHLQSPAARP